MPKRRCSRFVLRVVDHLRSVFSRAHLLLVDVQEQAPATAAALVGGGVAAAMASSKKRKARTWKCANYNCTAEADATEAESWLACSNCDLDMWFCPRLKCQEALASHEEVCGVESEEG